MTEGVLHLVPTCPPPSELRRGLRPCSDHHKIRPLTSCTRLEKGRAVLVDESLDRQRGPATNLKDVIVGAGEDAVCVIDRDLVQMLRDVVWPPAPACRIAVHRGGRVLLERRFAPRTNRPPAG